MSCVNYNLITLGLTLVLTISSLLVLTNALEFTILHTNDVRSRVEETNSYGSRCTSTEACYGGVARTATVVKQIRKEKKNVVLLDAGDRLHGTEWYYRFEGKAQAEFMKTLGYDAMTLGNTEFTKGIGGLKTFLDNIDFPVLGCNIDTTKEPSLNGRILANTVVLGGTVGIIGYTTAIVPNTVLKSGIPSLTFKDAVPMLQNEVQRLQAQNVKIIIGLSHLGFFTDLKVAAQVEGIDVIVGGHSGIFLNTGSPPDREVAADDYPRVVKSPSGRSVLVVQAYKMSKYLGRLDVTFDDDGTLTEWGGKPILLDGNITPDPEVQTTVNTWAKDLHNFTLKQLGETYVFLDGERSSCRLQECNLGNLVTDAVLSCHLERPVSGEWSHVSMAMWNSGGIGSSIQKGDITELDVITVLPFNNKVVLVKMKGKDIRDMLQYSVHRHNDWDGGGRFLQLSGIRVVYDLHGSTDVSVHSVHVLCAQCDIPEYKELDDDEVYSFLTSQYLAEGGDGYDLSKATIVQPDDNSKTEADCVTKYIQNKSPIIQGLEERIRFVQAMNSDV